jgi:hypothetical protein
VRSWAHRGGRGRPGGGGLRVDSAAGVTDGEDEVAGVELRRGGGAARPSRNFGEY